MRTILGCALVLGLAAAGTADDKIDGKKLIGKWEPKEARKGARLTLEFAAGGKLTVTGEADGQEIKREGTYTLAGNKLTLHLKFGETEIKDTVTVTRLTDDEMEGTSDGKERKKDVFKRVKSK